jgi:hypothetical protein
MRRWPVEIERAIADAVIRGERTGAIRRGIEDGTLDGLSGPYALPQRTFYETLARVRQRLQAAIGPPEEDDRFLRELAEKEDAGVEEARSSPADKTAVPPEPLETQEQRMDRVVREIEALAEQHEDPQQREREELVEHYRQELEGRSRMIGMREALDKGARLDRPVGARELPRDPGGYLPDRSREYDRRRPGNR